MLSLLTTRRIFIRWMGVAIGFAVLNWHPILNAQSSA
jgi:hypothetical protein